MFKKYKIGFDIWGLLLFLIIMIPNFIWFTVPAPNDILRGDSITKAVDTVGSICQVLMIILLCILFHKERNKTKFPLIIAVGISCLLYFVSWVFYYSGFTNAFVVMASYPGNKTKAVAAEGCVYGGAVYAGFLWD
jgi:hypothetical protein